MTDRDRCQAQLNTLKEEQCPNLGDRCEAGGDGTALLVTYACAEHVAGLRSGIRQWRKA